MAHGTQREMALVARYKIGRCANGAERDGGYIRHAILKNGATAVCGAQPGRSSAGWSHEAEPLDKVSCRKCLQKLIVPCEKCGGTGWLHGCQSWTPGRMSKGTPYYSERCQCQR